MCRNRFLRWAIGLCLSLCLCLGMTIGTFPQPAQAGTVDSVYIGEIDLYPYTFCPQGTLAAAGQLLSISSNQALYSLLGTTFGGDGRTTFGLPDLRGRVPISQGQGPGLSLYPLGAKAGVETVTLSVGQMPSHSHTVVPSTVVAGISTSSGNFEGGGTAAVTSVTGNSQPVIVATTGGSLAHENRQPYLALQYCIALEGIYPSRP